MKRSLCVLVLFFVATTAVFAAPPSTGIGVGISAGLPFHAAVTTFDMMFSESGTTVGIGIPVTWSYTLEKVPMKFFVKAGPQLFFGGGLAFMGTIGGMYVFKL